MIGQGDHSALAEDASNDVFARRASVFVNNAEHLLDGLAQGLLLRPTGERRGDGVEEGDVARGIGGQDAVADAGKGDLQPLALLAQGLIGAAQIGGAGKHDFLQAFLVPAQSGLCLPAPLVFLREEEKDRRQQHDTEQAAGQDGLQGLAEIGILGRGPRLEQTLLLVLGLSHALANLLGQGLALARGHQGVRRLEALAAAHFDHFLQLGQFGVHQRFEGGQTLDLVRVVGGQPLERGDMAGHSSLRHAVGSQVILLPHDQVTALAGLHILQGRVKMLQFIIHNAGMADPAVGLSRRRQVPIRLPAHRCEYHQSQDQSPHEQHVLPDGLPRRLLPFVPEKVRIMSGRFLPGAPVEFGHHAHEDPHTQEEGQTDGINYAGDAKSTRGGKKPVIHGERRCNGSQQARPAAAEQGDGHDDGIEGDVGGQPFADHGGQPQPQQEPGAHGGQRAAVSDKPMALESQLARHDGWHGRDAFHRVPDFSAKYGRRWNASLPVLVG